MNAEIPKDIQFHQLKKIEVVVYAEDLSMVQSIMAAAGVSGWTMIRDVAGMGHSGFHQGRTIFSDQSGLVMFIGVAAPDLLSQVAIGLGKLFESKPGVLFLSDVQVLRSTYFSSGPSNAR